MKEKQLLNVVSKSFGLLCILYAFLQAKHIGIYVTSVQFYGEHAKDTYFYLGQLTLEFVFDLVVAWIFVYKADSISSKLTRRSNESLEISAKQSDIIGLVIVAIGAVAIVNAIPEILHKLVQYIYFNDYGRQDKNLYWNDSNRKAEIVFSIIKFAVGLIVFTNGRSIAKLLTKISNKVDIDEQK